MFDLQPPRHISTLRDAAHQLWSLRGGCFLPLGSGGRAVSKRQANHISMRQEVVVIGNEWNFGCCAERREFSIVRIFDEGKVAGIDTAGKLSPWAKEISELIPTEGRNSAQNKLGLAPGRFVPDQLKTSFPDSSEDTRRCAFRVEAAATKTFVSMATPSIQTSSITSWRRSRVKSSRVAPSSRASTSRLGSGSTAMIGSQPAIRAAINPARPTRWWWSMTGRRA
jgi:hypothetical protein